MPLDRDPAAVLDIVTAARLILEFKRGMDFATFASDAKTLSAIIHQLLIIGEATKRLSAEFKAAHPAIPWQDVARMRDKMIHHYEEVNRREVWRAAETDIPALLDALAPLRPS
ncbi:MAG: DUF86 domain-containing protein [Planctomycetes bacterium]|nr:DUF86 domain-containing protein [Planctomycetota bacterium]